MIIPTGKPKCQVTYSFHQWKCSGVVYLPTPSFTHNNCNYCMKKITQFSSNKQSYYCKNSWRGGLYLLDLPLHLITAVPGFFLFFSRIDLKLLTSSFLPHSKVIAFISVENWWIIRAQLRVICGSLVQRSGLSTYRSLCCMWL